MPNRRFLMPVLFAGTILFRVALADDSVLIETATGPRLIRAYTRADIDVSQLSASELADTTHDYGYFVVRQIPASTERNAMVQQCGIAFLSVYTAQPLAVYIISFNDHIMKARKCLAQTFLPTYNLSPFFPEDKASEKIFAADGFSPCEIDSSTGYVHASVAFFSDVPVAVCDSTLRLFIPVVISGNDRNRYRVKARPDSLKRLIFMRQVSRVNEEDTCSSSLNNGLDFSASGAHPPACFGGYLFNLRGQLIRGPVRAHELRTCRSGLSITIAHTVAVEGLGPAARRKVVIFRGRQ